MAKVTVYQVQLYDVSNDRPLISKRMATREGAAMMCGTVLENTAVLIEQTELENGKQWTAINFKPKPSGPATFQTHVTD